MSIIGNILWIFLGGGFIIFFLYLIGGVALCFTVIGIPFGVQCFKLSLLALIPFGKSIVQVQNQSGCLNTLMNVLWIITGGITIALTHLLFALLMAVTIIGIPFAVQHMKLTSLALMPFGKGIS